MRTRVRRKTVRAMNEQPPSRQRNGMNPNPKSPVWFLFTQHWLSLLGAALVTTAIISWLFVLPRQGHGANPYAGIAIFAILAVFVCGLVLIPIGVYLSNQQIRKGLASGAFDRKAALQRLAWFFGITTFANLLIGTQVTYRGVKYMETQQFCGATCHVMHPEFAAYRNAPHAKVECVECHVAPGAKGWIKSKTSGMRQLVETTLNTYPRPVPSAVESNRLVSAQETCEHCHWDQRLAGARLRVIGKFGDDQNNTLSQTVLTMMVGGSKTGGIHGSHFGPGIQIRFAPASSSRQSIPWIEYRNATTGQSETFITSDSKPDSIKVLPKYEMECTDCHNRPAHSFDSPGGAVDKALGLGDISATLPFIKKKSVELLTAVYHSTEEAGYKLPQALINFYRQNYPEIYRQRGPEIERVANTVLTIYNRNVFPDLKVTWGTYPNNLGHQDSPGCFRCHDDLHTTASGKTITQDCSACHEIIATEETSPEILKTLGIAERISRMQKP